MTAATADTRRSRAMMGMLVRTWAHACSATTVVALFGVVVGLLSLPALATEPKTYPTPEEAAQALLDAAASDDMNAIWNVLGDGFRDELENPDDAQERVNRNRIVAGAKEALQLRADDANTRVMVIGNQAWPMPIPIVSGDRGWRFDVAAGAEEILMRRIGANELAAVSNLQAYVDAQVQYASADRDGDDVLEYAQRINSSPGKKDGLYWEAPAGSAEEASPFGPFVAEKAAYLSGHNTGDPFMGYYYRIISRQGENAPGGRYDYVINGNMIAGFAMIAWPAEYGNSGMMAFIVNQNGRIYQKDLGEETEFAVIGQDYDPDGSWSEVDE